MVKKIFFVTVIGLMNMRVVLEKNSCYYCKNYFSIIKNTIFDGSEILLQKWFM